MPAIAPESAMPCMLATPPPGLRFPHAVATSTTIVAKAETLIGTAPRRPAARIHRAYDCM